MYIGGLGRLEHFDARNLDFLIDDVVHPTALEKRQALLLARAPDALESGLPMPKSLAPLLAARGSLTPEEASISTHKYHHDTAWQGNQLDEGACTAFALLHAMHTGPVTHPGRKPLEDGFAVYAAIQRRDRTAGRYFPEGATALAMGQEAVARGWARAYRWGFTIDTYLAAIKRGPVLIGSNWLTGMDIPDRKYGIIRYAGSVRGGHEYVSTGCDFDDGMVRILNSWGTEWGKRGRCYLPLEDLERALADGGDLMMLDELRTDDPRTPKNEAEAP